MRMRVACCLWWKAFFTFLAVVVFVVNASAGGPVILGGDDLTDHGSRSGTTLFDGWLYIQKALENLAPTVTRPGNDGSVAVLGSADSIATSGNAGAAYHFAVPNAAVTTSLSGIVTFHDGATAINQFFTDLAAGNVKPAIIVTAGTNAQNDLELDEGTALTDNSLAIANFVNSGGGLLSHGFEPFTGNIAYGWLTDLIPGASVFTGCEVDTLSLTLLGQLAFPGLTNSDIRSGPCHNHFVDHGLPVLARDAEGATADPGPPSGSSVAEPEPDDNGSSATADSFFIGDDYTGTITPETTPITGFDLDYVSFSGTAGQAIVATTVLGTLVDSALTLFDTDGVTSLAFNDDFGGSLASQIIFTLPSTGTFFLRMRNFSSDDSGTYTLQLRQNLSTNLGRNIIVGGGNISLPGQIALTPEVVFNPPGTDHTVTANVVDLAGNPLENILVTFEVLSGPNSGTMGTNTTVANGDASFTYTSNGEVELDVIQASFVDDVTGNTVSITARKYWDLDCQPNSIPDTCDLSCDAFNRACAADFPGCGRSVDTNDSDLVPDECTSNAPPVARCQHVIVATDAGVCTAASASVDNGSFDPDEDPFTLDQAPAGPYILGDTLGVTLTATDDKDASDSCTATVTVVDVTSPSISCPSPLVLECTGLSGASASFSASATDNCSAVTPTCNAASGSIFSLGSTTVDCNATDSSGNTNSCSSSVTVVDTTPPDITCPAPITAECTGPSGASVSFSATASDLCGPSSTSCPTSGSTFSIGSTDVSCSATDNSGYSSSCGFGVTVIDTTAPTAYCIESVNPSGKNVPKAKKVNEDGFFEVSASDICMRELTITLGGIPLYNGETIKITQSPGKSGVRLVNRMGRLNIKHFQVGPGDAVVTATDGSGNQANVTCPVPPKPDGDDDDDDGGKIRDRDDDDDDRGRRRRRRGRGRWRSQK